MFTVYKIENTNSGEFYIGVHKTDNPHDSYMGSGIRIKRQIAKYGREYFQKTIIEVFDRRSDAYAKEVELLKHCLLDEKCLNLSKGGVGGDNFSGKKHSEETRAIISRKRKAQTISAETRSKISENNRRRTITDESRRKMSEKAKIRNADPEYRNRISQSLQGYKHSEETKEKMRISWAKRNPNKK